MPAGTPGRPQICWEGLGGWHEARRNYRPRPVGCLREPIHQTTEDLSIMPTARPHRRVELADEIAGEIADEGHD